MTPEGIQAANLINTFPPDLRVRLRDALFRIADVYVATTEMHWPSRQKENAPEGVILLSSRRRPHGR